MICFPQDYLGKRPNTVFSGFVNRDDLIRKAEAVRRRKLGDRPARSLQDAYTLAFWLAKRLHRRYPDTRIMVGDDSQGHMHHWIEIPSLKAYVDPAHDASADSGPPVLAGSTEEVFYKEVIETSLIPTLTSKKRGTSPNTSTLPTLQNRCTKIDASARSCLHFIETLKLFPK